MDPNNRQHAANFPGFGSFTNYRVRLSIACRHFWPQMLTNPLKCFMRGIGRIGYRCGFLNSLQIFPLPKPPQIPQIVSYPLICVCRNEHTFCKLSLSETFVQKKGRTEAGAKPSDHRSDGFSLIVFRNVSSRFFPTVQFFQQPPILPAQG